MFEGWFSVDRSIFNHWISPKKPYSKFEAWIDLFGNANHAPSKFMKNDQLITVQRGETARSQVTLSKDWGWSRDKVKRFLKLLQDDGMIELKTSHLTSIISICNYEEKQNNKATDKAANRHLSSQRSGSTQGTNNNDNNVNNDNNTIFSEAVVEFECIRDEVFYVYQSDIDEWSEVYSAVDVNQDLKEMKAWFKANKSKKKTKGGMPKFINSWLSKTQNRGGNRENAKRYVSGKSPAQEAAEAIQAEFGTREFS